MAVKKVSAKNAEVETTATEEVVVDVTEDVTEDVEVEVKEEEEVPEVEIPEVEVTEPEVEVNAEEAVVNTSNKPNGNVKIRMRVDHKCCIAMERYELKAGKTYVVPENVKRILNKAGLLAPL